MTGSDEISTPTFENQNPNLGLLLSFEEEAKANHEHIEELAKSPEKRQNVYVYHATHGEKELLVYGTQHIRHLDKNIERAIDLLEPDFVLVEGSGHELPKGEFENLEELAKEWGEMRVAAFLAKEKGIEVDTWDLDWVKQREMAMKKMGEDAWIGWALAQSYKFSESRLNGQQVSIEEITKLVNWEANRMSGEYGKYISEEKVQEVCIKYTGKGVEELNLEIAEKLSSPRYDGETNQASKVMVKERDFGAIKKIFEALKKHNKVFVIAGKSHAITWKPVFEDLFEQTEQLN